MQGSDTVSPCDREPCKGDQIAYEQARAAAAAAVQATQNTLDARPTAAVAGLTLLGVALAGAALTFDLSFTVLAGAGGLIVWTGFGTAPGGALIAAAAASGGGAVKLYNDWKNELAKKRADCATARAAFIAAKDKLMNDCPAECWPRPFPDINCP